MRTFVELQGIGITGPKVKRVSNRFDGPGYDYTRDPFKVERRRAQRRELQLELRDICGDSGCEAAGELTPDDDFGVYVHRDDTYIDTCDGGVVFLNRDGAGNLVSASCCP